MMEGHDIDTIRLVLLPPTNVTVDVAFGVETIQGEASNASATLRK